MAGLQSLTDPRAVVAATDEFDRIGRDAFLAKYKFGRAKWWYLVHAGKQYDSKAIVGAAIGIQTGKALTTDDFSGGEASVVRKLHSLGFRVLRSEMSDEAVLPEEVPETFPEGMRVTVTLNRAERSLAARLACIEIHGTTCVVCGMDFEQHYGADFAGLIHVHHLKPLGTLKQAADVEPRHDLRPVCPNCHAAIHYGGVTRTVEEIQEALRQARAAAV